MSRRARGVAVLLLQLSLDGNEVSLRRKLPLEHAEQIVMPPEDPDGSLGIDGAGQGQNELVVLLHLAPLRQTSLHRSQERRGGDLLLLSGQPIHRLVDFLLCRGCLHRRRLLRRLCLGALGGRRGPLGTLKDLCGVALLLPLSLHPGLESLHPRGWDRSGSGARAALPHPGTRDLLGGRRISGRLGQDLGQPVCRLPVLGEQRRVRGGRGELRLRQLLRLLPQVCKHGKLGERPATLRILSVPVKTVIIDARTVTLLAEGVPIAVQLAVNTPALAIRRRVPEDVGALLQQLLELVKNGTGRQLGGVLRGMHAKPAVLLGRALGRPDGRPRVSCIRQRLKVRAHGLEGRAPDVLVGRPAVLLLVPGDQEVNIAPLWIDLAGRNHRHHVAHAVGQHNIWPHLPEGHTRVVNVQWLDAYLHRKPHACLVHHVVCVEVAGVEDVLHLCRLPAELHEKIVRGTYVSQLQRLEFNLPKSRTDQCFFAELLHGILRLPHAGWAPKDDQPPGEGRLRSLLLDVLKHLSLLELMACLQGIGEDQLHQLRRPRIAASVVFQRVLQHCRASLEVSLDETAAEGEDEVRMAPKDRESRLSVHRGLRDGCEKLVILRSAARLFEAQFHRCEKRAGVPRLGDLHVLEVVVFAIGHLHGCLLRDILLPCILLVALEQPHPLLGPLLLDLVVHDQGGAVHHHGGHWSKVLWRLWQQRSG
mmetsp:Transcript_80535/g.254231  ORF Transcript_80535/g.254231 Transcript_80535/m.254231 type:complete len:703 (-) Transcript_80535:50-2158(-)